MMEHQRSHLEFGNGLAGHVAATAALFAGLVLLRFQFVLEFDVGVRKAFALGLGYGLLDDLAVAVVPSVAALLLWGLTRASQRLTWCVFATSLWLLTLANVVYFRYFGDGIEWWVIRYHSADLLVVLRAIAPLIGTLPIKIALLFAGAATVTLLALWARRRSSRERSSRERSSRERSSRQQSVPPSASRRRTAIVTGVALLFAAATSIALTRTNRPVFGSVLNEHVLYAWAKMQVGSKIKILDEAQRESSTTLANFPSTHVDLNGTQPASIGNHVAWLRDLGAEREASLPLSKNGPISNNRSVSNNGSTLSNWPLYRELQPSEQEVSALRQRLGLPRDSAPNIVVLFLETVRGFELQDDRLGPLVFPKLRERLANSAVQFDQAYSSAIKAGQTVRGQFSTLCSMLPNMNGAATFLSHYNLNVTCLAELARDNGYQTAWISAQDKEFHNKYLFESLHGTERFFDYEYFVERGAKKNFENCGVADAPFFNELTGVLEKLVSEAPDRPLFVNALNISTHVPHSVIPEGEVPAELRASIDDPAYLGYVSRLRYLDDSLDLFLDDFFASPLADNTAIFLLGDHSFWEMPPFDLAPHQRVELLHRVPLAVISKNLEPARSAMPVHQVDIAPTIARLGGLDGVVGWIGRGLFESSGTPWVYRAYDQLHYRHAQQACYSVHTATEPQCYEIGAGIDPLFASTLPSSTESPELTERFARAARENGELIVYDRILPRHEVRVADLVHQP